MKRSLVPLTLLATLAVAAPAAGQAVGTATPPKADSATKLRFDVDGLHPVLGGRVPKSLSFAAPAGFRFDTRAFSARCSRQRAILNECPKGSAMGRGMLVIGVTLPEGSRDANIPLYAYMSTGNRMFMVAYVTGWRVVPGVVRTTDGIALDFDPLPTPPPFPNVTYTFKRITLDIGATRTIRKVTRTRSNGRRRTRVTRTKVNLLRTPAQCPGSWAASVTAGFPDGTALPLAAPMTCTP